MMRYLFLVLSVFVVSTIAATPVDARQEGIALVVNEDAISFSDLNQRLDMVIASSGLPDNPDIRKKLVPQVVGSLVEEQIKLQEAIKQEISVSDEEIEVGFAAIAQQNNFPPEKFKEMVKKSGINITTMQRQIRAQLSWNKVIQQRVRTQITVTESDIDTKIEHLAASKGESEYLLAEIFLPVEAPEEEAETRQLVGRLLQEMKKGARFSRIAQQFSKAPGASRGGDMGWVQHSQLPEELSVGLQGMNVGDLSAPIRTVTGYHLLLLREKREITEETLPSREEVMALIGTERLERKQRRYLLDLKSSAFIDNRVGS